MLFVIEKLDRGAAAAMSPAGITGLRASREPNAASPVRSVRRVSTRAAYIRKLSGNTQIPLVRVGECDCGWSTPGNWPPPWPRRSTAGNRLPRCRRRGCSQRFGRMSPSRRPTRLSSSPPPDRPVSRRPSCSPARRCDSRSGPPTQRLGGPGDWVCALPTQHVAGLMTVARAVVAGTEVRFARGDLADLPPATRTRLRLPRRRAARPGAGRSRDRRRRLRDYAAVLRRRWCPSGGPARAGRGGGRAGWWPPTA